MTLIRCAIYTRKSSEEGLEQDFNSLHAQREACEAYIKSQAGIGWKLIREAYDDGGVSGGTLERPGLQKLLKAIQSHRIDIIVVYKVDRLTRSLMDFAKLVEIFDGHGVSFVSITQAFNTTTSMGRLTLNMLLSFSQFEREITAERIRDKLAASKKKGLWMGGTVPIGYKPNGRTLVISEDEARVIRSLFERYLILGSVPELKIRLDKEGALTPKRRHGTGRAVGGVPFSRGQLYTILNNPVYAGRIRHKTETYPGQHPAIIEEDLWHDVQAKLDANAVIRRSALNVDHPSLLAGLLFDHAGQRLTPSHAIKGGKRYRYYVGQSLIMGSGPRGKLSPSMGQGQDITSIIIPAANLRSDGWRIPAPDIETIVTEAIVNLIQDHDRLMMETDIHSLGAQALPRLLTAAKALVTKIQGPDNHLAIRSLLRRIEISNDKIETLIDRHSLLKRLGVASDILQAEEGALEKAEHSTPPIILTQAVSLKRCGRVMRLLLMENGRPAARSEIDPVLIKTLQKAHRWWRMIATEKYTVTELARIEKVTPSYVTRVIRLAFLSPDITTAILSGTQPLGLDAKRLTLGVQIPILWTEQRQILGFTA